MQINVRYWIGERGAVEPDWETVQHLGVTPTYIYTTTPPEYRYIVGENASSGAVVVIDLYESEINLNARWDVGRGMYRLPRVAFKAEIISTYTDIDQAVAALTINYEPPARSEIAVRKRYQRIMI